jgi:hypothetical protein
MKLQHDTLKVQCIYPKVSKPLIDRIDLILAQHYGFTAEELDFIINYGIKYRVGAAQYAPRLTGTSPQAFRLPKVAPSIYQSGQPLHRST